MFVSKTDPQTQIGDDNPPVELTLPVTLVAYVPGT